VLAETIFRKTRAEVAHNRIASDFCDHRRRRDAQAVAIAVDDRGLGQRKGKHRQAVDENVLRLKGESGDGRAHRLVGRAQDVDRVDLDRIDDTDRPCDSRVGDEFAIDFLALLRQELFRIVQLSVPKFFRKNNRGCYNRSRERAAACFVDPGDRRKAKGAQFPFMTKSTAPIHAKRILSADCTDSHRLFFQNLRESAESADGIIPAPQSLPCPCGCGDSSASPGGRGLPFPLPPSRCAGNEAETRVRRLRRRRCGEP
jgi:hypothetical protein